MSANIVLLGMGFLTQVEAVKGAKVTWYSVDVVRTDIPELSCRVDIDRSPKALLDMLNRLVDDLKILCEPYSFTCGEGDQEFRLRSARMCISGTYCGADVEVLLSCDYELIGALRIPNDGSADGQTFEITTEEWLVAYKQLVAEREARESEKAVSETDNAEVTA